MSKKLAIVIPAYNRTLCLSRLLNSLSKAEIKSGIDLFISIDDSNLQPETVKLAADFEWKHGRKEIIKNQNHLGLKNHILQCGALLEHYEALIVLEDDLVVSPFFTDYVSQALDFFSGDKKIAGISLYNYQIAESCFAPFNPLEDGSDNYFIQTASSWGQCYTKAMWFDFIAWLGKSDFEQADFLPEYIMKWGSNSWKKHFIHYLIEQEKYFVFPVVSLSTNFGDPGTNTDRKGLFQTPLLQGKKKFEFKSLSDSESVYDAWFEPIKLQIPGFSNSNIEIDLYGTKNLNKSKKEFSISSKRTDNPVKSFGFEMPAIWQNVTQDVEGNFFSVAQTVHFSDILPPRHQFFPQVNSIREIVFGEFTDELSNEKLAKHLYAMEFPAFRIIVKGNNPMLISKTIKSIASQNYPFVDVTILSDDEIHLDAGFKSLRSVSVQSGITDALLDSFLSNLAENSICTYFALVAEGTEYLPYTFFQVRNIFKRFVEIHWLIGTPVFRNEMNVQLPVDLAMRRMNKQMYLNQIKKAGFSNIDPASCFFTKSLLNSLPGRLLMNNKLNYYENLWRNMFEYTEPYFSSIYCCFSTVTTQMTKPNSINEWFFKNNIPYLRYFYTQKMNLNPIVRFEHRTNSYYLSEY